MLDVCVLALSFFVLSLDWICAAASAGIVVVVVAAVIVLFIGPSLLYVLACMYGGAC